MKKDFSAVRLCVLVSTGVSALPFETLVGEILAGGADCVQLREKNLSDAEFLELAKACRDICRDVVFVVNDRPDIAVLSDADGVHVGQSDLPCRQARQIVGDELLVGVSTSSTDQLAAAERAGADYAGVGCIFPTTTKEVRAQGVWLVRSAARVASVPLVAVGGINLENAAEAVRAGAHAVAVCSAIVASGDPRGAARAIRERVLAAEKERSTG